MVDPFRLYQQITRGAQAPVSAAYRPVQVERPVAPPPPPMPTLTPIPLPPAPTSPPPHIAPPPPPRPPTLQEWARAWRVEAIAAGADASVLLSHQGQSGLYRAGETLEGRVQILKIERNRIILGRGSERATLEVTP